MPAPALFQVRLEQERHVTMGVLRPSLGHRGLLGARYPPAFPRGASRAQPCAHLTRCRPPMAGRPGALGPPSGRPPPLGSLETGCAHCGQGAWGRPRSGTRAGPPPPRRPAGRRVQAAGRGRSQGPGRRAQGCPRPARASPGWVLGDGVFSPGPKRPRRHRSSCLAPLPGEDRYRRNRSGPAQSPIEGLSQPVVSQLSRGRAPVSSLKVPSAQRRPNRRSTWADAVGARWAWDLPQTHRSDV